MKVYAAGADGQLHLIGRADIPDDGTPAFDVRLFGAKSTIIERYTIGTVTRPGCGDGPPNVERAVLLAAVQRPEFLPGWQPLAS